MFFKKNLWAQEPLGTITMQPDGEPCKGSPGVAW